MLRRFIRILLACICPMTLVQQAFATTVTIHTDDARATLLAMQNPSLGREEAMTIAKMHGNQGVIRKLNEFKIPSTAESFANALYACAHGQKVTEPTERAILLDMVKPKVPQLLALLQEIEANPKTFQESIEQRIAIFAPPNTNISLEGYIVAAGDGGGYAFGDTDFFLNIGMVDDFILAKETTMHELYHAVQGAFAAQREAKIETTQAHSQQACANFGHLFANLYEEGSAMYVGDLSLVAQSHSPLAARMQADLDDGLAHAQNSATLLEMSAVGLNAAEPVPYDDMYAVDFLGHGVVYDIAYVMAQAIVEQDGPQGLADFLKQPTYKFVLRYTELKKYRADKDHPGLGPNTIAAANRLATGCK